jgi:hypothetical protein
MTFEDPRAGLIALAALLPIVALVLSTLRARRVAAALGLQPPPTPSGSLPAIAAVAVCLLLAAAAARPALVAGGERRVRTNSEILFVVDVTRSMLAAPSAGGQTRLARARLAARALREAVPTVPAALAGLTDRVLPYSFASPDLAVFAETLARSVAIESPPPRTGAVVATAFDALATIGGNGFFGTRVSRRTCVFVTDGESRPFLAGVDRRTCRFVIVRVGTPQDRVWGPNGVAERAYRADPVAERNVERLAAVTGGRAWPASQLGRATDALRALADRGPTRPFRTDDRNRSLSEFPAGAAVALTLLLVSVSLARRRVSSQGPVSSPSRA